MSKADATPRATAKRPATPNEGKEPAARPSVVIPVDPKLVSSRVRPHAPKAPNRALWSRHVAVAAAVIATLATGLIAVRPLGVAGGPSSGIQAFAGILPWTKPTATPAPWSPPQVSNPGQQAIIDEIVSVFGSYAPGAVNVARCESEFDPNARNVVAIGNSHAMGVFQILYPSTWNDTSYRDFSPYDPHANIRAAFEIFQRDGYSWREWACRP